MSLSVTEHKCVRIEMEYDDGEVYKATGNDAEKIADWIGQTTVMQYLHAIEYSGPKMKKVNVAQR